MKSFPLLVGISAWLAVPAGAQSNLSADSDAAGPRTAVERFVALNAAAALGAPEGRALLGGELARVREGSIGPLARADRIVMLDGGKAVARLPASPQREQDLYLYLSRGGNGAWTVNAIRALALPAFLIALRDHLRGAASRSADEDATLANIELTTRTDAELHAWFAANRASLDRLRQLAEAGRTGSEEARRLVGNLHALGANNQTPGVVTIVLGGIMDNSVGFLHADDPGAVPAIDPIDYIWIEPVGEGWYLFRTT